MAYAWNPTTVGMKNEETVLVTENEIDVLSTTGDVPTRTVEAVNFDVELTVADMLAQ
jgi:hypothetical protein